MRHKGKVEIIVVFVRVVILSSLCVVGVKARKAEVNKNIRRYGLIAYREFDIKIVRCLYKSLE